MMHSWWDQFGKRTAWLLSYFLIYVYLNILAQSQILRNSLYHLAFALGDVFATKPGDEFQSNRLVLAGDEEIMDTDKNRFVEIHQKA